MLIQIDLRKGFGEFRDYNLFKFPDNTIKFKLTLGYDKIQEATQIHIITTLRTNDDIITLALVKDCLNNIESFKHIKCFLTIHYMIYQQDDRKFSESESFGLKVICNFINSMNWDKVYIFHPHSDKVEFINNLIIIDNKEFITSSLRRITPQPSKRLTWVIPDAGAFKTQFKIIEKTNHKHFITCLKSRNHETNEITTVVNCDDLEGRDCVIIDDICLGGRTFINIAQELKKKNCGKLYLIVSHGIFNNGINHLLDHFEAIYTTNSIFQNSDAITQTNRLKIYNL